MTGESERRFRDVAGVIAVQCEGLDQDCVVHWVHALGLESEWCRALRSQGTTKGFGVDASASVRRPNAAGERETCSAPAPSGRPRRSGPRTEPSARGARVMIHPERIPLLRGEGRYVDDIRLPGTAHLAFVRSPHAHARVAKSN